MFVVCHARMGGGGGVGRGDGVTWMLYAQMCVY